MRERISSGMFQSHAGSIEATEREAKVRWEKLRFNPTLVRLRPLAYLEGLDYQKGFNPTLVRLRPAVGPGAGAPDLEFQSHAGSIEAAPHPQPPRGGSPVSIPRWFD